MSSLGDTAVIVESATRPLPAVAAPSLPPEPGGAGSRFGPYRLVRLVGHGGMAAVWEAELCDSAAPPARLALKLILPHLRDDPDVARMFRDEARLAMRLRHPNLVRATSSGWIDGEPFIALELIDGIDLRACIDARVPFAFAAWVARRLCAALSWAHRLAGDDGQWLELVHRDVTPSNVMLGRDGAIKLLDFGIAKALGDASAEATRHGIIKGKLGYMAPELIAGRPLDQRADLYSLGVVLYELVTHAPLYAGKSETDLPALLAARPVPPPSAIVAGVPPLLERVVLRALERDPARRYATADDMGADLDEVLRLHPWSDAQTIALVQSLSPRAGGAIARTQPYTPATSRIPRRPRRVAGRAKWGAAALLALAFGAAVAITQAPAGDALAVVDEERAPPSAAWNLAADAETMLSYEAEPPVLTAADLDGDPPAPSPPSPAPSLRSPAPSLRSPAPHRAPRPSSAWHHVARPAHARAGDADLTRSPLFNPFASEPHK